MYFQRKNFSWQSALLPELVAKYFTRRVNNDLKPHISTTLPSQAESGTNSQSSVQELWCSYIKPEYGRMIAPCDGRSCLYQWCHFECIGLKRPPQGLWYSLECSHTKQLQAKGKASKKNKK
ncbi:hypothetical protein ACJMK2_001140 [Sinanodonta woodiana]|uniref:Uncharacterized protein n=1 Tax=Sinanodonta woodiana TaxID=1069815 RepID=A0ABD3XT33_SINWO